MNLNCKVLTDEPAQLKGADPKGVSTPDVHWIIDWMRIQSMRIGMRMGTLVFKLRGHGHFVRVNCAAT